MEDWFKEGVLKLDELGFISLLCYLQEFLSWAIIYLSMLQFIHL